MSRRLEKINRTIKEAVSGIIQNDLSDPRIQGLISITRVQVSADLSKARVYLSILGTNPKEQELSTRAIDHAAGFIQSRLAELLTTRACPSLSFYLDDSLKKNMEIMNLLQQIACENKPAPTSDDAVSSFNESAEDSYNEK